MIRYVSTPLLVLPIGVALCLVMTSAHSQILNPANGHYYDTVDSNINWSEAKLAAETASHLGFPGHLATITSQAEDDFIFTTFGADRVGLHWLGGYQDVTAPDYHEPEGGWRWVTGEVWDYTNWLPGEPNNSGDENFLHIRTDLPPFWNDYPDLPLSGYIIEFEPNVVPAPGALLTALIGIVPGATLLLRRRRKKSP